MAPPRNTRRRNALADAAIELLGTAGIHRLSHRAVDERADLPAGTAANYFPRRDDLLAAAAERVAELALADMTAANMTAANQDAAANMTAANMTAADRDAANQDAGHNAIGRDEGAAAGTRTGTGTGPELLAALIGAALHEAATRHRTRYLAAYELALESTRQPALAQAMARLGAGALGTTISEHLSLGLPTTPEQVQTLIALYNGTLLTLLIAPPGTVTPEATSALARALVAGALAGGAGVSRDRSE